MVTHKRFMNSIILSLCSLIIILALVTPNITHAKFGDHSVKDGVRVTVEERLVGDPYIYIRNKNSYAVEAVIYIGNNYKSCDNSQTLRVRLPANKSKRLEFDTCKSGNFIFGGGIKWSWNVKNVSRINNNHITVTTPKSEPSSKKIRSENHATTEINTESVVKKPTHQNNVSMFKQASNWAVIIGISQYEYAGQNGLKDLIFADDDGKAFANSLRNLGWSNSHIKLLINEEATHRNIMIALESWLSKAGSNDQIILYWAGHGFPDPEDPEKVYLACYDTDITIPATGYRMDKVSMALKERNSKNVILLADTCHAGKLITRGDRGISIVPKIYKMRQENKVPKGWIFMVGADTDRQAIEHSSWSNGAFTHTLIQGLEGRADGYESAGPKDGIVTMGELKAYMNTVMPDETQRVLGVAKRPVITTSTGDPNIWNLSLQISK